MSMRENVHLVRDLLIEGRRFGVRNFSMDFKKEDSFVENRRKYHFYLMHSRGWVDDLGYLTFEGKRVWKLMQDPGRWDRLWVDLNKREDPPLHLDQTPMEVIIKLLEQLEEEEED